MHNMRVEQRRILWNNANGIPQACNLHLHDILVSDEDLPGGGIVETEEKPEDCVIPHPEGPAMAVCLAAGMVNREHWAARAVHEIDIHEADVLNGEIGWASGASLIGGLFSRLEDSYLEEVLSEFVVDGPGS
ncbi:hypothetical protein BDP27DRAFT_1319623 [Rhodocollybia butyracea]|uniref:Uncharacterized protein n=1 Tax=Rhodocollybia butyracea TaxID=206335 RepID=A0A9P5Q0P6_9AGAR|nr:hypothetical protein BDP27DRAFT_1319623 [Rhodocollybia butyracea]